MITAKSTAALKAIFPDLPDEGAVRLVKELRRISREAAIKAIEGYQDSADISDEVAGLLQLIASRSSDPQNEILRKALILYMNALDYVNRGDRLAVLAPDDTIVREITGIGSSRGPDALATH